MFKQRFESLVNGAHRYCATSKCAAVALAVALLLVMTPIASATTVTIPDSGADVSAYITAAITAMGSVVAVAVGGYFAFLIVKLGLRWGRNLAG